MKNWKKITLLTIVAVAGLIYITDSTYLFKAFRVVVLQGHTDVSIYDYKYQDVKPIKSGKGSPWNVDENYNKFPLSDSILKLHDKLQSIAFIVIKDGKILSENYFLDGGIDVKTGIWSISKTYTSLSILKAIDDGLIESVDDPLKKYIPEWDYKQYAPVTLRHLASMSAGLNWDETDHTAFSLITKFNFYDNINELTIKKVLPQMNPGEIQHYNSGGTQFLGIVLDRVLQQKKTTLADYISEKFWKPLQCEYDALYVLDSKKSGKEKAFGGMVATARDVSRLGQLILQNGVWKGDTILNAKEIKLLKQIPYNNTTYTYGMWTGVHQGKRFIYQAGVKGQFCITLPEYNLVITRLGRKSITKNNIEDNHIELNAYIDEALRISRLDDSLKTAH